MINTNPLSSLGQQFIVPDWPAPPQVHAVSTTRLGGISQAPYDSFNLGFHTGDSGVSVSANRRFLRQSLGLSTEPVWLKQVHGKHVVDATQVTEAGIEADASYTQQTGIACVVMTADCLPILLTDANGTCVAAIHAGWRGLANGVISATVSKLTALTDSNRLIAWLGPAIGPTKFEVGQEVFDTFLALDSYNHECFRPSPTGRWLADIYGLARQQLSVLGVLEIYGGKQCTVSETASFFSYRRDSVTSGRMASLIWLDI